VSREVWDRTVVGVGARLQPGGLPQDIQRGDRIVGQHVVVQALADRLGHVINDSPRAVTTRLADFPRRPARCVPVGDPQRRSVGPVPCGVQRLLLGLDLGGKSRMDAALDLDDLAGTPSAARAQVRPVEQTGTRNSDVECARRSSTERIARSRSSFGYFLGAAMIPPFRGNHCLHHTRGCSALL
jgi:hypothetical protein